MATVELSLGRRHFTLDGVPSILVHRSAAEPLPALRTYSDTRVVEALNHLGISTRFNMELFLPQASVVQIQELVSGLQMESYFDLATCIEQKNPVFYGGVGESKERPGEPRRIKHLRNLQAETGNPEVELYQDRLREALMEHTPTIEMANRIAIIGSLNYRVVIAGARTLREQGDSRRARALDAVRGVMDELKSMPSAYNGTGDFVSVTGLGSQPKDLYGVGAVYHFVHRVIDRFDNGPRESEEVLTLHTR